ncbi:LytR/AlgR family response regulator transcription factor [Larkinella rosea]|uniref:DNA-binding response regulator n=1 Tax=Larkinella rosea TaxID=2025312 RepID=A0A3P1BUK1_9BACT|nr:LytTR family DNA-binding domain-containing protein [Larkinella rosea]RRB04757.1 DNA-binding response regulator [Larkinella rosea]
MAPKQCLIIGDSNTTELSNYLNQLPLFSAADVCTSLTEAWKMLRQKSYNLVWLDMHKPDQTGLDMIRSFPKHIPVIVTSTHADFAVDSFDLGVVDYLLKPFTFLRFTRAINRALSAQLTTGNATKHPFIFLKMGYSFQRFDYQDIDYVQAYGIYSKIIRRQKVDAVNDTISNLEQGLPNEQFLRVHKSYIVNLAKMTSYSSRTISIGDHQIPLGAAYRERFQGFLSLLNNKRED